MLIDLESSSETADHLRTRLVAIGDEVKVSDHKTFSIAYSGNSLMMRQGETQRIFEYRGLTQAAAEKLIELSSHQATRSVYYHSVGSTGDAVAVGVNTGTDSDYEMVRVGDSNAFTVKRTDKIFEASPVGRGWSTTRPSASGTGIVVSTSGQSQMVWYANLSGTIYQFCHTTKITVTQYKFRTQAEAATLVNNNTSDNTSYQTYSKDSCRGFALTGTIKSATSRYVDGDSGYTVDVTAKQLGGAWA